MNNLKKDTYLKVLFILSTTILVIAYTIQYILGYQPCNLCIIERITYALSMLILIFNYKFKKNELFYCVLLMIVFTFSFLISVYHFGIEQGLINESNVCASNSADLIIKEDVLKSLQKIKISCKDVAIKFFSLSLTTYNMIISVLMFLISLKIYLINNEIKK